MEVALQPGRFIASAAVWDFVSSLEGVDGHLAELVRADPERAVSLYETFLAGCYEKAEELDDSSGKFGMFVVSLYRGRLKARQAARADVDATARLLERMENDPYGFASTLERDAVKVMHKDGLAALERQAKARFEATDAAGQASESAHRRDPAPAPPLGRGPARGLRPARGCASLRRALRAERALGPGLPCGRHYAQGEAQAGRGARLGGSRARRGQEAPARLDSPVRPRES
jgi:hypothetical protein